MSVAPKLIYFLLVKALNHFFLQKSARLEFLQGRINTVLSRGFIIESNFRVFPISWNFCLNRGFIAESNFRVFSNKLEFLPGPRFHYRIKLLRPTSETGVR